MVAIHSAQKHGVNAEERYGLQKYRFPITDSGRLARTAVHRHPPRCPSPTWTGHRNNTACAKGCPLLPGPLVPGPPLSASVPRFTRCAILFPRAGALFCFLHSSNGRFFFLFSRSVRFVCTTGPRVLRSSVQTNRRMLSASLSLFHLLCISLFLSLSIPFLSHPPFSPILRDTVPALLFQLLVPASFSRAYSRLSPPPSFLSLYSLCLHSSHDD